MDVVRSVWSKPPQCLKINSKDDLSVLFPSQYIKPWGKGGAAAVLQLMVLIDDVVLYLYDYGL